MQTMRLLVISLACSLGFACGSKDTASTAPTDAPASEPATAEPADASTQTIVDVAVAAGQFNTLATALEKAGLVETLKGPGPFTVFAPTDEAFAKLPAGALDSLLADPEALKQVLLLHVVSGKVMASDVTALKEATAVSGGKLTIDTTSGVKVSGANVVKTDIAASNGVIHVIDTVILPPK